MNFSKEYKLKFENNFGENSFSKLISTRKEQFNSKYIRINISKTSIGNISKFLINNRIKYTQTFIPNALKIKQTYFNLSSSLANLSGEIYLQDLASQVPVNCINFKILKSMNKKIKVLDMCSSPGSKTSQIIDLFKYHKIDFKITAIELENIRIKRLINNLQKQSCENIEIYNINALDYNLSKDKNKFDLILLDAPCSGNLIGDKNWLQKRDFKGIKGKSEIQKTLLKKAKTLLNEKGIIIYSTCSMEIEENEENINWAINELNLKSIPNKLKFPFEVHSKNIIKNKEIKSKLKINEINCIRFMPYLSKTQGFFVCCLEFK